MGYEAEAIRRFDDYCREKRKMIAEISDEEQKHARRGYLWQGRSCTMSQNRWFLSI